MKKATQRQVAVEVRTLPDEPAGDAERGVEEALLAEPAPDGLEAVEHLQGRLGGDGGTIDRADRRADDEVRQDVPLEQGPQHPDLVRTKIASAPEDVGHQRGGAGFP